MPINSTKLQKVIREELLGFHPRLFLAQILTAALPMYVGGRSRAAIYRMLGFEIGAGTIFWGKPYFIGGQGLEKRFHIGEMGRINVHVFFDLLDHVTIGDHVSIGQQVMFVTSGHSIGDSIQRTGALKPNPITVCDGCWIGAGALIMPGVTIDSGSIVAAGAVVTHNVPANTIVAGIPAKVIRELEA